MAIEDTDLMARLKKAGIFSTPGDRRQYLYHAKQAVPTHAGGHQQFRAYLRSRQQTVGQILILAGLIAVDPAEKISKVEETGAFWQLFKGSKEMPACHTSPCLILLNGLLPHVLAKHPVLQQEIILNFGCVMLMPDFINRVDAFIDDKIGSKQAMVKSVTMVMLEGSGYRQALEYYHHVRATNLRDFLAGFSSQVVRPVTMQNQQTGRYEQTQATVIDDELTELRLILGDYKESEEWPIDYKYFDNYEKSIKQKIGV